MDNRPAKTRITTEEFLVELIEANRERTRESLRGDGWFCFLDLRDGGLTDRMARRVLEEKRNDLERRSFKVEGVKNKIYFYRPKAKK